MVRVEAVLVHRVTRHHTESTHGDHVPQVFLAHQPFPDQEVLFRVAPLRLDDGFRDALAQLSFQFIEDSFSPAGPKSAILMPFPGLVMTPVSMSQWWAATVRGTPQDGHLSSWMFPDLRG